MGAHRLFARAAGAAAVGLVLATGAAAKEKPKDAAVRAAVFDKVAACRKITDSTERLACFDNAVAALEAAEKSGDVVVVDRAQIHEAKRQAFGLQNFDSFNIFNRGAHPEVVEKISGVIARASQDGDGKWVLTTQDGQVWSQTEAETFYPDPKPGDQIEIRSRPARQLLPQDQQPRLVQGAAGQIAAVAVQSREFRSIRSKNRIRLATFGAGSSRSHLC